MLVTDHICTDNVEVVHGHSRTKVYRCTVCGYQWEEDDIYYQ